MAENMSVLDSLEGIKALDKSNVLGSMQALAEQVEDAWEQVGQLSISVDSARIKNVVVAGMGGSALGPDVILRTAKKDLKVPFEIARDYSLPGYVNEDTLVLVASYSGTTEETLAAAEEAKARGAQILGICTGGPLKDFLDANGYGVYAINPRFNPSNQPRMAIGYAVFGIIALLSKAGVVSLTDEQVNGVIAAIRRTKEEIDATVPADQNPAKQMAFSMLGRIPVLIAAEHLEGAVHVFQNQLNENAKIYAEYRVIPELNHHLMEGLRFPQENDKNLFFALFNSSSYHPRNQKRIEVTQHVIEAAGIDSTVMNLENSSLWEQVFEVISFGAYTNFYLAMLEGIDPTPIETVDFFKAEMKK